MFLESMDRKLNRNCPEYILYCSFCLFECALELWRNKVRTDWQGSNNRNYDLVMRFGYGGFTPVPSGPSYRKIKNSKKVLPP